MLFSRLHAAKFRKPGLMLLRKHLLVIDTDPDSLITGDDGDE
jgi:hypothetical protein